MNTKTNIRKQPEFTDTANTRIGLALGSGSARGWAHIGVIQALKEMGVEPEIVAGTSIGAIVGAAYAGDRLDDLEGWVRSLNWEKIVQFLGMSPLRGGFIQGEKLYEFAHAHIQDMTMNSLPRTLGVVATDLDTGREVWFQDGSLLEAVRASIGLPGLFTPVKLNGRWLVDGGLTNPVPISLCRAMGADIIIAVNLNGDIIGKHARSRKGHTRRVSMSENAEAAFLERMSSQLKSSLHETTDELWSRLFGESQDTPGMLEVLASSLNIMQDRITRSRMGGDPPEIILSPRLAHLGLMEFDQADIAIQEGHAAVQRMKPAIEQILL
ncbi:MAG: patatin-like phospholipase RssA [Gammaproteobacteria bacterium]|nr:MAG: patatin-like phospholipase RssA [Gammaproteobacteria bacterium]